MKKSYKKEDIQKIVLGILLGLGIIYGYFTLLLGPLKARQKAIAASIVALDPEISKAKAQIARAQTSDAEAPKAEETISKIEGMIPEGAPVSWFPVLIGDFFKQAGFEKTITRMLNESSQKGAEGFRRLAWSVDIPETDFNRFGAAIADLENEEPLITIENLTIETLRDDPQMQHVLLTVSNIAKE